MKKFILNADLDQDGYCICDISYNWAQLCVISYQPQIGKKADKIKPNCTYYIRMFKRVHYDFMNTIAKQTKNH